MLAAALVKSLLAARENIGTDDTSEYCPKERRAAYRNTLSCRRSRSSALARPTHSLGRRLRRPNPAEARRISPCAHPGRRGRAIYREKIRAGHSDIGRIQTEEWRIGVGEGGFGALAQHALYAFRRDEGDRAIASLQIFVNFPVLAVQAEFGDRRIVFVSGFRAG